MGKKFDKKRHQDSDEELSYDAEIVSDRRGSDVSIDSEEEAMKNKDKNSRKTGKQVQDRSSNKNKLRLGEFHRNAVFKQKKRKTTTKKQIRDIERLLDREGLPEEIRTAKKAELIQLKRQHKKQREAELFETKYKKIKFTEKRKVIRLLEQAKKNLKDAKNEK